MLCELTLPELYDQVTARFAADGTRIPNLFGWRKPASTEERGPRIVWVPGDPNGAIGQLSLKKGAVGTGNPRVLSTLAELFTLIVVSADTTDLKDERKQYAAVRKLFNAWWRAAFLSANASLKPLALNWLVGPKKETQHGAAIRGVFALDAPIPDETLEVAPADTSINLTLHFLDRTENVAVPPEV